MIGIGVSVIDLEVVDGLVDLVLVKSAKEDGVEVAHDLEELVDALLNIGKTIKLGDAHLRTIGGEVDWIPAVEVEDVIVEDIDELPGVEAGVRRQ